MRFPVSSHRSSPEAHAVLNFCRCSTHTILHCVCVRLRVSQTGQAHRQRCSTAALTPPSCESALCMLMRLPGMRGHLTLPCVPFHSKLHSSLCLGRINLARNKKQEQVRTRSDVPAAFTAITAYACMPCTASQSAMHSQHHQDSP